MPFSGMSIARGREPARKAIGSTSGTLRGEEVVAAGEVEKHCHSLGTDWHRHVRISALGSNWGWEAGNPPPLSQGDRLRMIASIGRNTTERATEPSL